LLIAQQGGTLLMRQGSGAAIGSMLTCRSMRKVNAACSA
jgi:hypothetical protein